MKFKFCSILFTILFISLSNSLFAQKYNTFSISYGSQIPISRIHSEVSAAHSLDFRYRRNKYTSLGFRFSYAYKAYHYLIDEEKPKYFEESYDQYYLVGLYAMHHLDKLSFSNNTFSFYYGLNYGYTFVETLTSNAGLLHSYKLNKHLFVEHEFSFHHDLIDNDIPFTAYSLRLAYRF